MFAMDGLRAHGEQVNWLYTYEVAEVCRNMQDVEEKR